MKNEETRVVEAKTSVEAKKPTATPAVSRIELPESLSVRDLASVMSKSSIEVIKQLMRNGVMANINQVIDFETAANVATAFGFQVVEKRRPKSRVGMLASRREKDLLKGEGSEDLQTRPPVVTILGHVDHGKTTLLDAIRKTNVTASEAGGITQHIGAYQVDVGGRKVTFLDTPGHEAFTAMRARGAQVTDIAVLVVAADDGVMPQTIEAIDHAKAAGVPIVVAANKMDKPDAQPDRIKQQLADHGLVIEEWGGDVIFVPVSAKKGTGISDLLENLLVVAEIADLKANPNRPAVGIVVEAGMDKSKGPMATVLIKNGTLHLGDIVVVGETTGKIKALFDDKGKRLKEAGPAMPVGILGLSEVPGAGDELNAVKDEQEGRKLLEQKQAQKLKAKVGKAVSLDNLFARINAGQMKEVNVVLKADVQGSIQPIRDSMDKLSDEQVRVNVIHAGTGSITESDILLALASKAIVVGFNIRPEPGAKRLADIEGVDVRFYNIIYNLIDDMGKALKGMLEPTFAEVVEGHAEVRAVFGAGKNAKIAGCLVRDGKVSRGSGLRVVRQGKRVHESRVLSLRRFKEDVAEVATGFECGIGVEGFNDLLVGDMLESFRKERTS